MADRWLTERLRSLNGLGCERLRCFLYSLKTSALINKVLLRSRPISEARKPTVEHKLNIIVFVHCFSDDIQHLARKATPNCVFCEAQAAECPKGLRWTRSLEGLSWKCQKSKRAALQCLPRAIFFVLSKRNHYKRWPKSATYSQTYCFV